MIDFPKTGIDLSEIPDGYVDVSAEIARSERSAPVKPPVRRKKEKSDGKCVDTVSRNNKD